MALRKHSFNCSSMQSGENLIDLYGRTVRKPTPSIKDHMTNSIAVARTPGVSHDHDAFKRCGDDAGVEASISPNVRLAPIERSNDFPCLSAVVERYKIILPDCGF